MPTMCYVDSSWVCSAYYVWVFFQTLGIQEQTRQKSVFPRTHTLEIGDPTRRGKGRRNDDSQVFVWEEAEGVGGTNLPEVETTGGK